MPLTSIPKGGCYIEVRGSPLRDISSLGAMDWALTGLENSSAAAAVAVVVVVAAALYVKILKK